jgi:hypothetical protein
MEWVDKEGGSGGSGGRERECSKSFFMETLLRKTFENTPSPSLHSLSLPPYRIKCVQNLRVLFYI